MSGITPYYQFRISSTSSMFRWLTVSVDRYHASYNHMGLVPKTKIPKRFIEAFFKKIPCMIQRSLNYSFKSPRLQVTRGHIRSINISVDTMRFAIDRLTKTKHITADTRSDIADALKELELSLSYQNQLSSSITPAQRELIEFFIGPYIPILKETMEPWEIELSLEASCNIIKTRNDKLISFQSTMESYPLNPGSDSPIFVIRKEWPPELKEEVSEALYMIGTVLTGKANLESALSQAGASLPNLSAQEKVVMNFIALPTEPSK